MKTFLKDYGVGICSVVTILAFVPWTIFVSVATQAHAQSPGDKSIIQAAPPDTDMTAEFQKLSAALDAVDAKFSQKLDALIAEVSRIRRRLETEDVSRMENDDSIIPLKETDLIPPGDPYDTP